MSQEAVSKELNTVGITQKFLGLPSGNSRTLWWYSDNAGTDGIHVYSSQLERVHLSERLFVERSVYLGERTDSGWKRKRQSTASSLLCNSELFSWKSRWKKNSMMISQFLGKCIITVIGNDITMSFSGLKLSKVQDLGLQTWQTKSFAIITHNPVSGDCIFRVFSEKRGDRVLFEILSTSRRTPKVTLKSKWPVQQQREPIYNEVITSTSKVVEHGESQSGTRDGTRDVRGVEIASGNNWQTASEVDVNTDLRVQEVAPDALLQDEANTQENQQSKCWMKQDFSSQLPYRKIKWYSVKSRAVLSSRWAMWSWLRWRKPRRLLNVLLAWNTYLRAWPCVNVAICYDPIKVRWTNRSSIWSIEPHIIVLHQSFQEGKNSGHNPSQ